MYILNITVTLLSIWGFLTILAVVVIGTPSVILRQLDSSDFVWKGKTKLYISTLTTQSFVKMTFL